MREDGDDSLGISAYKMIQPFEYDVDSDALTALSQNVAAITISSYVATSASLTTPTAWTIR